MAGFLANARSAKNKRSVYFLPPGFALFCSIVFTSHICVLPSDSKTPSSTIPGTNKILCIEGTSDLFSNYKVKASKTNIRLTSRMGGSLWKDQTPQTITLYNNENKVYFVQKIDAYLTELNQGFLPIPISELGKPEICNILGQPAKKYKGYANLGKMGRQCVAEISCLNNVSLSPITHQMWCKYLGLNVSDFGLPIVLTQQRAAVIGTDKKVVKLGQPHWVTVLNTKKIVELPSTKGAFALEPEWKPAKDKASLLFSKDGSLQAKDIDDFFRSDAK